MIKTGVIGRIKYKNISTKIIWVLCFLMFFSCCFCTHSIVLKMIPYFGIMVLGFRSIISDKSKGLIVVGAFFPMCLAAMSALNNGDLFMAVKGAYPAILFLTLPVLIEKNIDVEKIFESVMGILIALVLGVIVLDAFLGVSVFSNPLLLFLYKIKELGVATKGAKYFTYYKIYLAAESLLVIYACYCFERRKYLICALSGLVLFFSGSSANPLAFMICIFAMIIDRKNKIKGANVFFCGSILVMAIYTIVPLVSGTENVRLSVFEAYWRIMRNNPITVLVGEGYGTGIYVDARKSVQFTTEWSLYEFIRWYGIIGTIPFLMMLVIPLKKIFNTSKRWVAYGVIGYLTIAFTNQVLYSTTGMIAYLLLYYECRMIRNPNRRIYE